MVGGGGGALCITCAPQHRQNRGLMMEELHKIKQTREGVEPGEATGRKVEACVFECSQHLFFC